METDVSMASANQHRSMWHSKDVTMQTCSGKRRSLGRGTPDSSLGMQGGKVGLVCFRAPWDVSDEEGSGDSDGCTPSFSMHAPGTSSDDDEDAEVTSKPAREVQSLGRISPSQEALHSLTASLHARLLASTQRKAEDFQSQLRRIDMAEARELKLIKARRKELQEIEAGMEKALRAEQTAGQKQLLAGLQQQHDSQAQSMARQALAAQTKAQQEQREEEEATAAKRRAQAEAEAKAAQLQQASQAAAKAAAQRESQAQALAEKEAAEAAAAAAERQERSATCLASSSGQMLGVRIPPDAAKAEEKMRKVLVKHKEAVERLKKNKEKNSARRELYKSINKVVGQIGGTQEQVNAKSSQLLQLLSAAEGEMQSFALINLAEGFLDLAEGSDSRFAAAEVAVALGNVYQDFVWVLLAKLHQACPLSAPKVVVKLKQEHVDDYFKRWAYRKAERWDKQAKAMVEGWEEEEVYLRRVTAHIQFYAAFLQSDKQKQVGLDEAWSYMSRLLNLEITNRYTAFALTAFVEIAGYRFYLAFRCQAMKILQYVWQNFLPALVEQNSAETASAARRLSQYLQEQKYLQEPPGRKLEMYDASTYDRA